jgi:hypothetical protein
VKLSNELKVGLTKKEVSAMPFNPKWLESVTFRKISQARAHLRVKIEHYDRQLEQEKMLEKVHGEVGEQLKELIKTAIADKNEYEKELRMLEEENEEQLRANLKTLVPVVKQIKEKIED